ncbi:MAG TPA: DoxX family protein [Myxococcaceae bacterium]|nr:DoxX family protein [Myxococcaceae bacterium]
MPPLSSIRFAPWLLQALPTAFLAILFLQSGIDKIIDFRGNQGYLSQHFDRSPLRGVVTPMLVTLTIVEVSAGVLCGVGLVELVVLGVPRIAFWGITVASIAFLALFFGQRIAKDYTGAAVLPAYLLVALAGLYMTGVFVAGRLR